MKIQNRLQAEEKAGREAVEFLVEELFGDLIPCWAVAVVVAVVVLCAGAIKLVGQD